VTDPVGPSRALQALTAAALALPGMAAANAADAPSFNVQLGHYWEGKRDLDGQSYKSLNLKPLEVDSFAVQGIVPVTDRLTFKGNFTQDSWSGATPVTTVPSAAVQTQLLSGASSPNSYSIDQNGTPNVVDFNQYDPDTDTYAHYAHPGLVHVMASASPETRRQWDGSLTQEWDQAEVTLGGGISDEHDFLSRFVNLGGKVDFNNKLTVLNWGGSYTWDRIRASIAANSAANTDNYADQIRDYQGQPTIFGRRRDLAVNAGITQILNPGALVQADLSFTRSSGLLANPYKAALFAFNDPDEPFDNSGLKYIPIKGLIEQRPNLRNQWAFNVRLAQHLPSDGALHASYRFFSDDWGIRAHTLELSLDQPLGHGWMITPDARYYSQTAANFYAPFFLLDEAYPFHPGGGLAIQSPVPLKYFSSDERLSAFGALSGSLALQKSLGRGLTLDLSYEYYVHKGSLKLGGGGEGRYADFHSSLATAGLSLDLARRADELSSRTGIAADDRADELLTVRPAGLLMPDVLAPGGWSVSAAYSGTGWKGPVQLHGQDVGNNDLVLNACGVAQCTLGPINAAHHQVEFQFAYALLPALTLSITPTYIENSLALVDVFPDYFASPQPLPPFGGGPTGSGGHSSSSWGDTRLLASYDFTPRQPFHLRIAGGLSVPTGEAGRTLNSKTDYASYSLQTGSGTWDAIGAVAVDGASGLVRFGTEISGVKRLGTNKFGYRLGDSIRGDLWAGADVQPWLTLYGRFRYDHQQAIHGGYKDHYDKDALADVPHVVASPDDLAANHGGSVAAAGAGLALRASGGPFKGDRLTVEWLKPVSTHANGYQLRPGATINAKVTVAL
jgi:hypothetical protein